MKNDATALRDVSGDISCRYERWSGTLASGWTWLTIARTGIRLAAKGQWTRLIILSVLPLVVLCIVALAVIAYLEEVTNPEDTVEQIAFLQSILGIRNLSNGDISELKEVLWRTLLSMAMSLQMIWVAILAVRVGPGLIAKDIKAGALPIYFSRPVTPLTYLLAKWLVMAFYIGTVTLIPNLLIVLIGTLSTGPLSSSGRTAALLLDVVFAGGVIMVLGGLVMLFLSSHLTDSRQSSLAWIALALLPSMAQVFIDRGLRGETATGFLGAVDLQRDIRMVQEWILGLEQQWQAAGVPGGVYQYAVTTGETGHAAIVLAGMAAVSGLLTYRRILFFSRSSASQR